MAPLHAIWTSDHHLHFNDIGILDFISQWFGVDLRTVINHIPALIISPGRSSMAIERTEEGIKIPLTVIATVLLAVLAANWGLFTMYMDSKWSNIDNQLSTVNKTIDRSVKLLEEKVTLRIMNAKLVLNETMEIAKSNRNRIHTVESRLHQQALILNTIKPDNGFMRDNEGSKTE